MEELWQRIRLEKEFGESKRYRFEQGRISNNEGRKEIEVSQLQPFTMVEDISPNKGAEGDNRYQ